MYYRVGIIQIKERLTMKKLMDFLMPIKFFAAMIFVGLMCLYMVSGIIYAHFADVDFYYSIPFVFAIQGLVLSLLIALMWEVFFGDVIIKKWRFFRRIVMFKMSLLVLFAVCFLTSFGIPTHWTGAWFIAILCLMTGIIAIAGLSELNHKKTGKRYTEVLRAYQANIKI
jgi:hypothetical protein